MKILNKSLAEFIGTFALVFAGCGSMMVAARFPGSLPPAAIPIIFGLTVATMVYTVGHISGAHFNPAVTIAFAVVRHFPKQEVFAYCFSQVAGSFTAMCLLNLILPAGSSFGATVPVVGIFQAFVWEVVLTYFLMFVIIAVATDTRAVGTMAGVAIGAAVMIGSFVGGHVTGASMNPARSLAPAFFQHKMHVLWIYIVAPIAGAIAGAITYETIRCEPPKNLNAKGCC